LLVQTPQGIALYDFEAKQESSKVMDDWTVQRVSTWMEKNGATQAEVDILKNDEVDGCTLAELDKDMLTELGFEEDRATIVYKKVQDFLQ
jgi:hypothetical protein